MFRDTIPFMTGRFVTPSKIIVAAALIISALVVCGWIAVAYPGEWIAEADDPPRGTDQPAGELGEVNGSRPSRSGPAPTPDAPHALPGLRSESVEYVVQAGDYLRRIAQGYMVSVEAIVEANQLASPDLIEPGQVLVIPPPQPDGRGPAFKVIPDAELVYGPSSSDFDLPRFIQGQGGYLASYKETVGERELSGVKIVERVAQEFSVNPRLLLAALEYQSGWVTGANPDPAALDYPLGILDESRKGLYRQLAWTANTLNRGYYLYRVDAAAVWNLSDGTVLAIDPTINAGTAAVQHLFAQLSGRAEWEQAVSAAGLFATYERLFGYPFSRTIEPLIPPGLEQPEMQLPFEKNQIWSFTGGPHGGWGDGSAWAALDFAPPGEALGCVPSDAWVVAVANGLILRAAEGAVVQDLDGDGLEQTGWTVLYMHIESPGRVRPGTYLRAGERIGHPSCEGGVSTGTHVHLARRYNGEWIPADQSLPFKLDGWKSIGAGNEYDGYLKRNGKSIEALNGRHSENSIGR